MSTLPPSGFTSEHTAEQVTEGLDLSGQTWLVTGCNSGLGLETIRVLHARGATIIGAARTVAKANTAFEGLGISGERTTAVACELSDLASVRAAVDTVTKQNWRLTGIIANAGIMALPTLQQKHGYELQFFTNHCGHFVLVTGLVGQLEDEGRIVMLSSGAHRMTGPDGIEFDNLSGERDYDAWRMYGQSKLANILFAKQLQARFEAGGSKKTAHALHPGVIKTNLSRHIDDAEAMFDSIVASGRAALKTVAQGASTQCYVATAPALNGIGGLYFADNDVKAPTDQALDTAMAERLWRETETIVNAL